MSESMIWLFVESCWQTIAMTFVSCAFAMVFGIPLGIILLVTREQQILQHTPLHRFLAIVVNSIRSIPFIILLVAITPFTRFIVGSSIGTTAAMVPLAISAIPFLARLVESALKEVSHGLIEASQAMGAAPWQIIRKVLVPEAMPGIVRATTLTMITLVGYSAMAGAIGGGGLGDLAIRYGYQRFEVNVMIATVLILIVMVQIMQMIGDGIANYLSRHREGYGKP